MPGVARKGAVAAAVAILVGGLAACGSDDQASDPDQEAVFGLPEESPSDGSRPNAAEPEKVEIPSIGISAPIDPVNNEGGVLTPPSDADRAGWWSAGPQPGDQSGRVLIAGHTLSDGGGAFEELGDLAEGDTVTVTAQSGEFEYVVKSIKSLSVDEVAEKSGRIFRTDGPERLVLVTCEDWDGEEYLANTVVIAKPA